MRSRETNRVGSHRSNALQGACSRALPRERAQRWGEPFITMISARTSSMPERSELATSTAGQAFPRGKSESSVATLRLSRTPERNQSGNGFAIEDDSGRAIVSLSEAGPFELFVKVGRMRSGYCTERLDAFVKRDPSYQSLRALDQDKDAMAAEWAILEGATVSVLVTNTISAPSDDSVLGVREVRPIVVF